MTIKEFLDENKGINVKIGFGSCFVYCGTITPETSERLETYSDYYLEQFKNTRSEADTRIENYLTEGRARYIERRMIAQNSEYNRLRIESRAFNRPFKFKRVPAEDFGLMYDKYLNEAEQMRKRAEKSILRFVPFLDAEISEIYPSITEPALIVISKNNRRVNGRFWTIKEYREECLKAREENGNI